MNPSPGFQGIFKSADGGTTWSPINHGLHDLLQRNFTISALIIDPSDSNIVYLASSGGVVFRSIDGGSNWTKFNEGLASLDVRVLALSSGTLYVGTSSGVFTIRPGSDHSQTRKD
jgi:photosystem II stability/assembly factor-like uncharacterized protein